MHISKCLINKVKDMLKKCLIIIYNAIRMIKKKNYKNILLISPTTRIAAHKSSEYVIGKNFRTRNNIEINIREKGKFIVGNNVFINSNTIITCRDSISIGDNCIIAPNVMIFDHDHKIYNGQVKDNEYTCESIEIGKNVWIGAGCTILKGSKIGENSIIGAQSIVKGEIPANTIYIQKPNIVLRKINERG